MKRLLFLLLIFALTPINAMKREQSSESSQTILQKQNAEKEAAIIKSLENLEASMVRYNVLAHLITKKIENGKPVDDKKIMQLQSALYEISTCSALYIAATENNYFDNSLIEDLVSEIKSVNSALIKFTS